MDDSIANIEEVLKAAVFYADLFRSQDIKDISWEELAVIAWRFSTRILELEGHKLEKVWR